MKALFDIRVESLAVVTEPLKVIVECALARRVSEEQLVRPFEFSVLLEKRQILFRVLLLVSHFFHRPLPPAISGAEGLQH